MLKFYTEVATLKNLDIGRWYIIDSEIQIEQVLEIKMKLTPPDGNGGTEVFTKNPNAARITTLFRVIYAISSRVFAIPLGALRVRDQSHLAIRKEICFMRFLVFFTFPLSFLSVWPAEGAMHPVAAKGSLKLNINQTYFLSTRWRSLPPNTKRAVGIRPSIIHLRIFKAVLLNRKPVKHL